MLKEEIWIMTEVISVDEDGAILKTAFMGVFSTEEKAHLATLELLPNCKFNDKYFIGPAIVDVRLQKELAPWTCSYYPQHPAYVQTEIDYKNDYGRNI